LREALRLIPAQTAPLCSWFTLVQTGGIFQPLRIARRSDSSDTQDVGGFLRCAVIGYAILGQHLGHGG
jgi:hypothetical protein